ncbi:MAG: outer membrane protein assembly factor BamB family protein [Candidatus Limnocylindrales bacterium]
MRFVRVIAPALFAFILAFGGLAALPGGAAAASSASWTQFHYGATRSGYNPLEKTLNDRNVGHLSVRWQKALGGTVYSTPVIAGDRIFVDGYYGKLYALRLSDGKKLWTATVGSTSDSTPAVWSNLVITPGTDASGGFVVAYDVASGSRRWRTRLAVDQYGVITAPAVFGSTVYVSAGTSIYALSASSGRILWKTSVAVPDYDSEITGPVAVSGYGEYVVAAGMNGHVYALNATTGALHWDVVAGGGIHRGGPAIYSGVVYVPEGATGAEGGGDFISALQVSDGRLLWKGYIGDDVHVTPAAGNGMVVIGTIDDGLLAFNSLTGALLWTAPYEGEVWGAPVLANGVVYAGTDENLVAHDAATGASLYTFDMSGTSGMAAMASPAVVNGRVYAATGDGTIVVLGLP